MDFRQIGEQSGEGELTSKGSGWKLCLILSLNVGVRGRLNGSLVADSELLDEAVGLPAQGSDVAPEKQQNLPLGSKEKHDKHIIDLFSFCLYPILQGIVHK